jgi:radical SAM protein with 4Fe4S-binding SPASM domain
MVNTPFEFNTLKWSVPGKTFARALIDLTRIARDRGVEVDSAITPIISALGNGIKRAWPCSLVDTDIMVSVDPLGNVSFCPQRWHHDLTVPLEFAREVLRVPVHHAEQCADCVARYLCGGPCPAFQRISGERIDSNKCAFMRAIVREILSNVDLFME